MMADTAIGYKEDSKSVQKIDGETFIQEDVHAKARDVILDLGCGTGGLSATLAKLVGSEGKVVGVDPDKERILLAQKPGGYSSGFLVGCAARVFKSRPYFRPKHAIFHTHFQT